MYFEDVIKDWRGGWRGIVEGKYRPEGCKEENVVVEFTDSAWELLSGGVHRRWLLIADFEVREPKSVDFLTAVKSGKLIRPGESTSFQGYDGYQSAEYWFDLIKKLGNLRAVLGEWYIKEDYDIFRNQFINADYKRKY